MRSITNKGLIARGLKYESGIRVSTVIPLKKVVLTSETPSMSTLVAINYLMYLS